MGAWESFRGELAVASGREFERRVAPVLKLFHRNVVQTPEMQHLDRCGIDFVVWSDKGLLPWVVQCKGFKDREDIGPSQTGQILESIEKFRKSPYSCEEYVLLHNRTGENRNAAREIEESLARLQREGKAGTAQQWDRQAFIRNARKKVRDLFIERMREDADRLLRRQESLFRFGSVYLRDVPVTERRLIIKRGEQMRMEREGDKGARRCVVELVLARGKERWTLLTGHFGTGKTTTGLHAAKSAGCDVIYVRADDLIDRAGGSGTNTMLARIVDAIGLFDDFDDEVRAFLDRVAGRGMAELLRSKEGATFALIIDALDESRSYGTPEGLRRLINQLVELKCSVILTTRREHFDSTFRNFDRAFRSEEHFQDMPPQGGPATDGRLFDLELWTKREVIAFLVAVTKIAAADEAAHLNRLSGSLQSGEAWRLYGELPEHPLFLQMILEEAVSGRIEKRNRAQLIQDWMERKIERDLGTGNRAKPTEAVDVGAFIEKMMMLQERVARRMTVFEGGTWRLLEHIDSDGIEAEARDVFRERNVDISTVLACSVLSAVKPRGRGHMPVKFLLRVCQEFFLAAALRRVGELPDNWPKEVAEFWRELGACYSCRQKRLK